METEVNAMKWNVYYYDFNGRKIRPYNVLAYMEDWMKKTKKKCADKIEFSEKLKREMMYHFWSKSEWELILTTNSREEVFLTPWIGCRNPEECTINISLIDTDFDWTDFAKQQLEKWGAEEVKIDVYNQLEYKWNEFVDYCWYFKHKYQRYDPKFERERND